VQPSTGGGGSQQPSTPPPAPQQRYMGWVKDKNGNILASAVFNTYEEAEAYAVQKSGELMFQGAYNYGVSPA